MLNEIGQTQSQMLYVNHLCEIKNMYILKNTHTHKTDTGFPDIENKLAVMKAEREMGTGKI